MRLLLPAAMILLAAWPAEAQRGGPHDGTYVGHRVQECRRSGRSGAQLLTAEVHGATMTIPGFPGDRPMEASIDAGGAVRMPRLGTFGEGTGQIFEGPNNARRFTGSHPGRNDCQLTYDLLRRSPGRR
ncbi:hypothetical protein EJV46_20975 [Roseococcus sp. SYP-B2431]|uniref:hypothetical protein n=1 Tax=Roseococcus sp. SYP-B2431 TaxID=2496640 RepID=UPI00103DD299|nr:hypothetical protein [Roseococcus sp. SYP-B2431]TCH96451.1 hypothetical protein EJV46_20975 [Roseococcus sp. SYP-B2431]